jgi:hypothetical protein
MIIPRGIQPEKSLYVIGASIISVLRGYDNKEIELDTLFSLFRKEYPRQISFSYFIYALDWLFLMGLIEVGGIKTRIKKCF